MRLLRLAVMRELAAGVNIMEGNMSKAFLFERNSCLVDIEGREFKLEEFSAKRSYEYVDLIGRQVPAEAFKLANVSSGGNDEPGTAKVNTEEYQEIVNGISRLETQALRMILANPVDGQAVADDWINELPGSIRRRLFEKQTELNELDRVLGNLSSLLGITELGRLNAGLNGQK